MQSLSCQERRMKDAISHEKNFFHLIAHFLLFSEPLPGRLVQA
jgi:hypothetical protein